MSININLVDKRSPEDSKVEKVKRLKGISFAILILTAFFAIAIFAIDYRFSASYVRKEQSDLMKQLEPYSETSAKIFILNSKLSEISSKLNQRKKYNQTAEKILEKRPEGLGTDTFQIGDTGISMIISSPSLQPIDAFLNYVLDLNKAGTIKSVIIKQISLETGKYIVELQLL